VGECGLEGKFSVVCRSQKCKSGVAVCRLKDAIRARRKCVFAEMKRVETGSFILNDLGIDGSIEG